MKTLLFCTLIGFWFPLTAQAQKTLQPKVVHHRYQPGIAKDYMIEIDSYDDATKTFRVTCLQEAGVGPNWVAIEDLLKAVTSLSGKDVTHNPKSIVGNQYSLDGYLPVLSEWGKSARKKAAH